MLKHGSFIEKGRFAGYCGYSYFFLWEDRLKAINPANMPWAGSSTHGQGDYVIIHFDLPERPLKEILRPMPDGLFKFLTPMQLRDAKALEYLFNGPLPSHEWHSRVAEGLGMSNTRIGYLLSSLKERGFITGGGSGPHSPALKITHAGGAAAITRFGGDGEGQWFSLPPKA